VLDRLDELGTRYAARLRHGSTSAWSRNCGSVSFTPCAALAQTAEHQGSLCSIANGGRSLPQRLQRFVFVAMSLHRVASPAFSSRGSGASRSLTASRLKRDDSISFVADQACHPIAQAPAHEAANRVLDLEDFSSCGLLLLGHTLPSVEGLF
jgi:hypothetical protein